LFNPVNCNAFYEIKASMAGREGGNHLNFLDHGGQRDAWAFHRTLQEQKSEQIIRKTLHWDQPYSERFFDNQQRDALALERLTDSPHVIAVYGFCDMTMLNEFVGNGNLFKHLMEHKDTPLQDLLVYARNILMGLADIHKIDIDDPDTESASPMPPGMPTLLYYDFRHHNMLLTDNYRIKVSDFNIAQLLR